MIVNKENERLYPSAYEYGAALVLSRLAELVKESGGSVKPLHKAVISNRNNDSAPVVTVTHTSYISFTLDGVYYSYSVSDNPFFPFHYSKTRIVDGKHKMNVYADELSKVWLTDPVYCGIATDEETTSAAVVLFELLKKAPLSRAYGERKRQRVYNRFDNRYHYEYITVAPRIEAIDF